MFKLCSVGNIADTVNTNYTIYMTYLIHMYMNCNQEHIWKIVKNFQNVFCFLKVCILYVFTKIVHSKYLLRIFGYASNFIKII